jgi:hypothetical protein
MCYGKAVDMKTLQAQIPESLLKQVTELASQEKTTVDQLVSIALAAQVSAWQTRESFQSRARNVNYEAVDRILAKVPNVPPMPGDELPEGYQPLQPKPGK